MPPLALLVLGCYMPGELLNLGTLATDLRRLQASGVNTIWLTHLSAAETAQVARQAAPLGISVVAALAELDGSVVHHRQRTAAQIDKLADDTVAAWGDAPAPIAMGMCDEPHADYMDELRSYINQWCRTTPWPVTTVANWAHLESASEIGCEYQAHFLYPFRNDSASTVFASPHDSWLQSCADNAKLNGTAWAMGQAFANRDYYRLPSPAEVTWQAYSAIAMGCKGFFAFNWSNKPGPEEFVSLAMPEMVDHLTALGSAYKRISKWASTLSQTVHESAVMRADGGVFASFLGAGHRFAMCVAGPDASATFPVKAWLMTDVETGRWSLGWGVVNVTVPAGGGKFLRVVR